MLNSFEAEYIPSGSMLFFAGRAFVSRMITLRTCYWHQLFSRRLISHVGTVFKHDGKKLIGESTTLDDTPCAILGKKIKGVQAHPINERVKRYNGKVWVLRFIGEMNSERERMLDQYLTAKMGQPYDAVGALISGLSFTRRFWKFNPGHFFCSELSASALRHIHANPVDRRERAGFVSPAELAYKGPLHKDFGSALYRVK